MSAAVMIKFPPPRPRDPAIALALPRRQPATSRTPFDALDASVAVRESLLAVVSATRSPVVGADSPDAARLMALERSLRQLEQALIDRERVVTENEMRLADRERDGAEFEALLLARDRVATATNPGLGGGGGAASAAAKAALEELRAELARQEATLLETKQAVRDREIFLDESEAKLMEKVQAQQDKENELEQREEDLRARDRRVREREAASDPQATEALKAADEAAKKRNEFAE